MEHPSTPTTIVSFTRRHRWRWWLLVVFGLVLMAYGLALLTSPAWSRFGVFGDSEFWVWLKGELYLVFGFIQIVLGVGYIRLTSRPAEALIADAKGISARRLYSEQRLAWKDITHVQRGRSSVLVGAANINFWRVITQHPLILRLDATVMDASVDDLMALIERYHRAASRT